jgi:hypothetical protein
MLRDILLMSRPPLLRKEGNAAAAKVVGNSFTGSVTVPTSGFQKRRTVLDCPYSAEFMPTPFESAILNLKLFELRREPVLREARDWFLREFHAETFPEFVALVSGNRNASFRMVMGYWDMAASLVTNGAIDADAFRSAHGEIFATFSKIQPFLEDLRTASREPEFCKHIETVVLAAPDAQAILTRRREALRAAAQRVKSASTDESANSEGEH